MVKVSTDLKSLIICPKTRTLVLSSFKLRRFWNIQLLTSWMPSPRVLISTHLVTQLYKCACHLCSMLYETVKIRIISRPLNKIKCISEAQDDSWDLIHQLILKTDSAFTLAELEMNLTELNFSVNSTADCNELWYKPKSVELLST